MATDPFGGVDQLSGTKRLMAIEALRRAGQPNPSLPGALLQGLSAGLMGVYEGMDERARTDFMDKVIGASSAPMGEAPIPSSAVSAEKVAPTGKGFAFPDKTYAANEFNPLDAQVAKPNELAAALSGKMTPKDLDVSARTVIGEAGGYNPIDKQNVAAVLLNRSNLAGTSPATEALKPNQFEPWNTQAGRDRMNVSPESPAYQDAARAVYMASEADPTGGATHFYSPTAQASLGRQPPAWDNGTGTDIGPHRFFNQPYAGQPAQAFAPQPQPNAPPQISQGPQPPVQLAQAGGQPPMPQANPQTQRLMEMYRTATPQEKARLGPMILQLQNEERKQAAEFQRQLYLKQFDKGTPSYSERPENITAAERARQAAQQPDIVWHEGPDGTKTPYRVDKRSGTVTRIDVQGQPQAGPQGITLPNGQTIYPPPGVDVKKWREQVTGEIAPAQAGKLTESQAKAVSYASRMEKAEPIIQKTQGSAQSTKDTALKGAVDARFSPIPNAMVNPFLSENFQQYNAAKEGFISGILRQESGAVINPDEFTRYDRAFFPQYGDAASVVKQKAEMRKIAIDAMRKGAGPMYDAISSGKGPEALQQATQNQDGGDALDAARAAIASGKDRNAVIKRLQEHGIDPSGL